MWSVPLNFGNSFSKVLNPGREFVGVQFIVGLSEAQVTPWHLKLASEIGGGSYGTELLTCGIR